MKRGDKLFVYGTLRPNARNGMKLSERAEHLGQATVKGMRLHNLGWFPGVKKSGDEEDVVTGDVFVIQDEDLPKELDQYEGYPSLYDRWKVPTEYGEAWIYVFVPPAPEGTLIEGGEWNVNATAG